MKRNPCKCSNRRNSLKNLISDYKNLHTEQKTLQKKPTAYLALAQAADEQLQAYTQMQRAFLDAQAGILAGSLQAESPARSAAPWSTRVRRCCLSTRPQRNR